MTLEGMRTAVMTQLHAGNLEVSIVGDLEPAELEVCRHSPWMDPADRHHRWHYALVRPIRVCLLTPVVKHSAALHAQDIALRYLGTIAPREGAGPIQQHDAIEVQSPLAELRRQTWHLRVRAGTCAPLLLALAAIASSTQ